MTTYLNKNDCKFIQKGNSTLPKKDLANAATRPREQSKGRRIGGIVLRSLNFGMMDAEIFAIAFVLADEL